MQKMVRMKATQSAASRTQHLMLSGAQAQAWNGACRGHEMPPLVPRPSSVRSAIFIVRANRGAQAPSGAACQGGTVRNAELPLPTELRRGAVGPYSYKHPAPNGAVTRASMCEIPRLTPTVLTSFNQISSLAPLRRPRTPLSAGLSAVALAKAEASAKAEHSALRTARRLSRRPADSALRTPHSALRTSS
jgi:hypothetical protein